MQEHIISSKDAINLLYEVECSPDVIQHCLKVRELSLEFFKKIEVRNPSIDVNLIEIGSILHDIGRSITNGVEHGAIGAQLAETFGLNEKILQIIRCHVGAGISKKEAIELKLPHGNYIPVTIEEKIVAHADNLVKGNRRISIHTCILNMQNKGINSESINRVKALAHEIFIYSNDFCNFNDK